MTFKLQFLNEKGGYQFVSCQDTKIFDCVNTFTNYTMRELSPCYVAQTQLGEFFKIENLHCKLKDPIAMNGCSNNSGKRKKNIQQKCWCNLFKQLIEHGHGRISFILHDINGCGLRMNIAGLFSDKFYSMTTPEERLLHWRIATVKLVMTYEYVFHDAEPINIVMKDYNDNYNTYVSKPQYALWDSKVSFITDFIPEKMNISHHNLDYHYTFHNCLAPYTTAFKLQCDGDDEHCWCAALNSLRSTGKAFLDITILPTVESINKENGTLRLKINRCYDGNLKFEVEFLIDESSYKFKQKKYTRFNNQYFGGRYGYGSDGDDYADVDDDDDDDDPSFNQLGDLFSNRINDY